MPRPTDVVAGYPLDEVPVTMHQLTNDSANQVTARSTPSAALAAWRKVATALKHASGTSRPLRELATLLQGWRSGRPSGIRRSDRVNFANGVLNVKAEPTKMESRSLGYGTRTKVRATTGA